MAPEIAEKLLIYHAGTGRTTFLSMFKVTTLFVTAFFALIAVPAYIKAEKPPSDVALVALGGILPIAFVAYTSAPFVTHMHIHLPLSARASRAALERFVRAMPPTTELTVTTMSVIGKPRYSAVKAGDLRPVNRRFGIVNYVRDATAENNARKWYQFRAVQAFHVPPQRALAGSKEQKTSLLRQSAELQAGASKKTPVAVPVGKKRDLLEAWIWDAIKEKLEERAAAKMS